MAVSTQPLPPGTKLNRNKYTVERLIGKGGFGFVYLARDPQGAPYAIKQCNDTASGAVMAFGQEIAVQRMLEFPSFAQVYEDFVQKLPQASGPNDPEYTFVAMEYVDGEALETLLERRLQASKGPFAEAEVLVWAEQLLAALEYAHSKHIIHRDIKPANIMLLTDGRTIKLLDVGIAKIGGAGSRTQKGGLAVSPGYSPPEQYLQAGKTDTYSDVYAAGATLYTLLTGKEPPESLVISNDPTLFTPPRRLVPSISVQTEQVILHAMQVQVAQRYQTAREMVEALTGKTAPGSQAAGPGGGPPARTCPACGTALRPQSRHCPKCGAAVATQPPSPGQAPAPPQVSVSPQLLDFGEQRYTAQSPLQLLFVRNSGGGLLQARVQSNVPWLELSPQSFALAAQQSASVSVEIKVERVGGQGMQRAELSVETGVSPTIQVPVTAALRPGLLLDGRDVNDGAGLIEWCDRNWTEAVRLLRSGELERMARFVAPAARRTQWDKRVADLRAQAASNKPDDLALEGALRALGAKPPACSHNWGELERELGFGLRPKRGARRAQQAGTQRVRLCVRNEGPRGLLYGHVSSLVGWISVPQPHFTCALRQQCDIELVVDARGRAPLRGFAPRLLALTLE